MTYGYLWGVNMEIIQKGFIFILLFICSNLYAFQLSSLEGELDKEDILKAIQRDEYLNNYFTNESAIAKFAQKKQCIRVYYPDYINYGVLKSKNRRAFKWAIDIPTKSDDIKTISELDALVKVKLLSKKTVSIKGNSNNQALTRYSLTNKGWGATNLSYNGTFCFYLGRAKHLSINSISKFKVPYYLNIKDTVYEVAVLVGLSDVSELPEWALHPDMREEFPLINKILSGYEKKIMMVNTNGLWHEYLAPSLIKKMAKYNRTPFSDYFQKNIPNTKKELFKKEIQHSATWQQEHGNPYWSCIPLPGDSSNGVEVDRKLGRGKKYSVAIFDNKKRSKWDTNETITKAYLENLVSYGLLMSEYRNQIEGKKKEQGQYFKGTVYKLAQEYNHIFDEKRNCIYLGKGKANIVDLQINASNTSDLFDGRESAKYKYIITFPTPPDWAKDEKLQSLWPDLQGALKYGIACAGQSKVEDITEEGRLSGSCWWAFDSVGEL